MASATAKANPSPALEDTVEEITRIYKSLPARPSAEVVSAAVSVIQTVETEQRHQLEDISKESPPQDVSPELFSVLQEVKKSMVLFQSLEQKKEASHLVELDKVFQVFDRLIQEASALVSAQDHSEEDSDFGSIECEVEAEGNNFVTVDHQIDFKSSRDLKGRLPIASESEEIVQFSGKEDAERLDILDVAAVIEKCAKSGVNTCDLRGKLKDKVEWLPLSIGKLSNITHLYLSENRIMALPTSIGDLKALIKLDIRANQIINLPSTFGDLHSLTDLDASANMLKSLPDTFGSLTSLINLDLSSNRFSKLPNTIGHLISLKRFNVETNDLEELPYNIGLLSSLVELRLDFNQLKALPESTGQLEHLEILTLHYNRVKKLPSTVGNLSRLREVDVSFNELEGVPETLCSVVNLRKLNVGKNFADLRKLPESLGNLEMLEELDISDNQIKVLPDSFRFLANLRSFRAEQTPLEVPPKLIIKLGPQAVVQYMADLVAERDAMGRRQKEKKRWYFLCSICPLLCFGIERS